ncbi:MAG: FtsX-like permease family protein [Clostridiaceae bacterium]|nr:FtsX-like permease family protein [Clostridiaceae bacterium]MBW4859524.1 FtsX-like permease family protein [Clostridiaceae bacterium]MBW4867369.1 FtsX-like permease family protein [Clostridiaceae bacterium]
MIKRNNNKNIIKRLVKGNIAYDRKKIMLTLITVIIAVTLITIVLMAPLSQKKEQFNLAKKIPQIELNIIDQSLISNLRKDADIEKAFSFVSLDDYKNSDKLNIKITYVDDPKFFDRIEGNMPKKERDIVIDENSIRLLNQEIAIGSELILNLGDGKKTYTITGIGYRNTNTNNIMVYCSEQYLNTHEDRIKFYSTWIYLKDVKNKTKSDVEEISKKLQEKYNISSNNIAVDDMYFTYASQNINLNKIFEYFLIGLVVLAAASLVIYNIYYISISSNIKSYGQLRAIGMSSKQVKKMVLEEGKLVAIFSSLLGTLLGIIIGYFMRPDGWDIKNAIISFIIGIIFGLLMVMFSIRKPAKIASSISPIEAVSYTGYKLDGGIAHTRAQTITPFYLAILNLKRNFKKTVITILSLSLSGILLLTTYSFKGSISPEQMARTSEFKYGEYKVKFEGDVSNLKGMDSIVNSYKIGVLQAQNNKLSSHLKRDIESIKGVKNIKEWNATKCQFEFEEHNVKDGNIIWGYSKDELDLLNQALIQGTSDYDELGRENGIIVNVGENVFEEVFKFTPEIGDKIKISFWNNVGAPISETFTIMGITDGVDGFDDLFRIPIEKLENITGYNTAYEWEIVTDSNFKEDIEKQLNQLVSNDNELSIERLEDYVAELNQQYNSTVFAIIVFVLFLGFFSLINLTNVIIINHLTRIKETGILMAAGLTKKQLVKSRIFENEITIIISLIASAILSIPIGYLVNNTIRIVGAIDGYKFPIIEYIVISVVMIILGILPEIILNQVTSQKNVVDYLRI